jgi:cardiolipin synthase
MTQKQFKKPTPSQAGHKAKTVVKGGQQTLSNIPNLLTMSRIAVLPLIMTTFYIDHSLSRWIAALAFLSACFTDFLDGYVARLLSQTSKFGQFLDPVADKLLVASTLFMLAAFGRIRPVSFLPALIILCREILVSGLREFLGGLQVSLPVNKLAKWKTATQMSAIFLLLIGDIFPFGYITSLVGEGLLWSAAFLTLLTGYAYLKAGLHHI